MTKKPTSLLCLVKLAKALEVPVEDLLGLQDTGASEREHKCGIASRKKQAPKSRL